MIKMTEFRKHTVEEYGEAVAKAWDEKMKGREPDAAILMLAAILSERTVRRGIRVSTEHTVDPFPSGTYKPRLRFNPELRQLP